jgi:predicted nucleotidyltransferase
VATNKPNMGIIMPNMGTKTTKRKPQPTASLADTLFSSTQQRVLGRLFGQPDRSFYATELIAAGGGSGAVQRELARLEASGLVDSCRIGKQKHYQASRASPIFEELRGIVLKTSGAASGLRVAEARPQAYSVKPHRHVGIAAILRRVGVTRRTLAAFCRRNGIQKLSFFGSVTREDFGPGSDVDVRVEFEPGKVPGLGIVNIRDDLSRLFGGIPVDLLTSPVISNPIRRRSIERDLTVAYASG